MSFKVYLYLGHEGKSEVRMFAADKHVSSSFTYLQEKLGTVFPCLEGKTYSVSWRDREGDDIAISTDEDLTLALQEMNTVPYKLYVKVKLQEKSQRKRQTMTGGHPGVHCDGCNGCVSGYRFKCVQCPDFDLCESCEGMGLHINHDMIRIAPPSFWMPAVHQGVQFLNALCRHNSDMKDKMEKKRSGLCSCHGSAHGKLDAQDVETNNSNNSDEGQMRGKYGGACAFPGSKETGKQQNEVEAHKLSTTVSPSTISGGEGGSCKNGIADSQQKHPERETPGIPADHVSNAMKLLASMGFTDEGGWLTQLLKTVDGDIWKVFDVLQPVKRAADNPESRN